MILAGARGKPIKFGKNTASLIDVVFLLLIYFMVTASLIRREADLGFMIPVGNVSAPVDVPVEVLVEIHDTGIVELEGQRFASNDRALDQLVFQIAGLRQLAETQNAEFHVSIKADPDALHYRVIDVMDACADGGVTNLGFAKSE